MTAGNKQIDWKTVLIGEALVLKLLARLLLEEPEKAWLQSLFEEDVFADIPFSAEQSETKLGQALLKKWSDGNLTATSEEWFLKLKVDHTHLFIGAGQVLAAPWESVHLSKEHMLFQEHTLQVRGWYRRFGIEIEKLYQEPDDHLGLEMSFLAHLAGMGIASLEAGDQEAFEKDLQAQRDFLTQHTLRWMRTWANLVEEHARTDFYRGISHLVIGALQAAADLLEIKMPDQKA